MFGEMFYERNVMMIVPILTIIKVVYMTSGPTAKP